MVVEHWLDNERLLVYSLAVQIERRNVRKRLDSTVLLNTGESHRDS